MNTWEIREGNALERLNELDGNSVHCVITSPPYWGLRAYGTKPLVFGREPGHNPAGCVHEWEPESFCRCCGAWRGELGREPRLSLFIQHMVEIFREIRRVLRPDGVVWMNMGDSFGNDGYHPHDTYADVGGWGRLRHGETPNLKTYGCDGIKRKDLIMQPHRLAIALQEDGWWVRMDVVWHKLNGMPDSAKDRPSRFHEYVFQLTKSEDCWFDLEAVAEPQSEQERTRRLREQKKGLNKTYELRRDQPHGQHAPSKNGAARSLTARHALAIKGTRHRRSVWSFATQRSREGHSAAFPEELVKVCLLSGCPVGGVVLDPFAGSATVGVVALKNGRDFIGLELHPKWVRAGRKRMSEVSPLFAKELKHA